MEDYFDELIFLFVSDASNEDADELLEKIINNFNK